MEDDEFNIPISPPSLKQKLKSSLCFSCCFRHRSGPHRNTTSTQLQTLTYHTPPPPPSDENPSLNWIKTHSQELPDNIKDKCRTIFNFIGNNNNGNRHRRHSSAEFRYDPLSYALNFEDGHEDDEAPLRIFTSRLPPPPQQPPQTAVTAASF